MSWKNDIEKELSRVGDGSNPGRTRTVARRIAGIALRQLYGTTEHDVMNIMLHAAADESIPDPVRAAVKRLSARLDAQFRSPSVDPVGDANMIVAFVVRRLT